jgi:hypothetical protein
MEGKPMTPDERQALREKHRAVDKATYVACAGCDNEYTYAKYPCDVIKVLDATENPNPTPSGTPECKHRLTVTTAPGWPYYTEVENVFTYCPKCGEKL